MEETRIKWGKAENNEKATRNEIRTRGYGKNEESKQSLKKRRQKNKKKRKGKS